jgi:hypothetical protein
LHQAGLSQLPPPSQPDSPFVGNSYLGITSRLHVAPPRSAASANYESCSQELIAELNPLLRCGASITNAPGPKTLRTSRRLDPAPNLVASVTTLAQRRLETAARDQVVRRVRACPVARLNTFSCILASLSLRESCIHETFTCSLRGGRSQRESVPSPTRLSRNGLRGHLAQSTFMKSCFPEDFRPAVICKLCSLNQTAAKTRVRFLGAGGRLTRSCQTPIQKLPDGA